MSLSAMMEDGMMAEQEDLGVEEKYLKDEVGGNASTVYRGEDEEGGGIGRDGGWVDVCG